MAPIATMRSENADAKTIISIEHTNTQEQLQEYKYRLAKRPELLQPKILRSLDKTSTANRLQFSSPTDLGRVI